VKPVLTEAENRLIAAYVEAALQVQRQLQTFTKPADRAAILQRINAILKQLDQLTVDYLQNDLPQRYKDGSALALAELRKLKIRDLDTDYTPFDTEAIRQLAEDARIRFANGIDAVRRDATVRMTEATKTAVIQKIMVNEIEGATQPAKAVKAIFDQQGIISLRSPARRWNLEDYADLLTRSISADAHNTGAARRYAVNGVDFARVIERETACKICQPMRGQVIWLGEPSLRPPYHPRCNGGIAPVTGTPDNPIRSVDDPRIPSLTRDAILRR
jgi:hypothetical protein